MDEMVKLYLCNGKKEKCKGSENCYMNNAFCINGDICMYTSDINYRSDCMFDGVKLPSKFIESNGCILEVLDAEAILELLKNSNRERNE